MISTVIEELIARIKESAPAVDSSQIRALISSALSKADIVSREEFDAQNKVLLRTRAKVKEMEEQLNLLEQQVNSQ